MKGRPDSAWLRIFWGVLCVAPYCLFSPSAAYPQETLTLIGHVRTQDGRVLPSGVTVRLETSERMPITTTTPDGEGHFEIKEIPSPHCHLIVAAEGFQPYLQDLDWGLSKTVTVSVYLVSINKEKNSPQAVATLTDDNAPKKARKEYRKGMEASNDGRRDEARGHLGKAVAEFPCYARAHVALAQIDMEEQKLENAEAALKKAIQCDSGLRIGYQELGRLYVFEQRFSEAEKVLKEGVRLAPSSWECYYILGAAYFGMRRYRDAEQAYLRAQSFNREMPASYHIRLANVYLKTNEKLKAFAQMQAYLLENPDGPAAERVRKLAKRLESGGVGDSSEDNMPETQDTKP